MMMSLIIFPFGPSYEWFWTMSQCAVVLFTLLFILRQIKLQNDAHLVNSFAILGDRWNSPMMLHARRDICLRSKAGQSHLDGTMHHLCLFFEELGAFCSKNVLDPDIVWEIYSFEIEHYWVMARDSITHFRKAQGDKTFYYHFERLYKLTQSLGEKKGASIHERTRDDVANFINHELNMVAVFLHPGGEPAGGSKPE